MLRGLRGRNDGLTSIDDSTGVFDKLVDCIEAERGAFCEVCRVEMMD